MSSKEFSNTSTGAQAADPYKVKNKDDDVSLDEKIGTLVDFVSACKFGMMTTRSAGKKVLASRCMAVAAKVGEGDIMFPLIVHSNSSPKKRRKG
jgi:hypothetical protein